MPNCEDLNNGRILALLGDSITTDHISPAGVIPDYSPAGKYLIAKGIQPQDFNSYGSRRGNHEIMIRGTFANPRLQNEMCKKNGGYTHIFPENKETTIYDASSYYAEHNTPLIIIAGKEYGTGSSRDWGQKVPDCLG